MSDKRVFAYIAWIMGWPLTCEIVESLHRATGGKQYSETAEYLAALVNVAVWVVVAMSIGRATPTEKTPS